jgi:hypothetical protein
MIAINHFFPLGQWIISRPTPKKIIFHREPYYIDGCKQKINTASTPEIFALTVRPLFPIASVVKVKILMLGNLVR